MSGAYRDRLFRPGDVRRILRRAAELQDQEKGAVELGRPQTLDELTRVAEDAGISQVALQRAVDEGEGAATARPAGWYWTGAPGKIVIERTIPAAVTSESHGQLVRVMRRATGELGTPGAFGDSLSWALTPRPSGGGRELAVVAEPVPEGTVIRLQENLANLRGGLFGGIVGGVGGGGLGLIGPLLVTLFGHHVMPIAILIWPAFVFLCVRRFYASRFADRELKLRAMADELSAALGGPPPATRSHGVRVVPATEPMRQEREEYEDVSLDPARRAASRR